MVHRWRCRHCDFTIWSPAAEITVTGVKNHILDHHRNQLTEEGFQRRWDCPYCDASGEHHDRDECLQTFQNHLFEHVKPLMESDKHVADDIERRGNVLVLAPPEGRPADNARKHFLALGDIAIFVTANPAPRLRLIEEQLSQWPAATIVITTRENPLEGIEDMDFANIPIEIVKLDKRMGLGGLGETISRVVYEHEQVQGKISFEFDILAEIIDTFQLEQVFKFLHALTSRLDSAEALSHYYVNPQAQSESTINVLDQLFDLRIRATEETFVSNPLGQRHYKRDESTSGQRVE